MPDSLILRALAGALVAGIVAFVARRMGTLTAGGQWVAFAIGTLVTAAGWQWAALLVGYFVLSSALTRLGAETKQARTRSVLAEHRERDALQVLANGGLFTAAILLGELTHDPRWTLAALGALAAAMADTWATEIGLLWGGTPRSILTGQPLPAGGSGGLTLAGTAASGLAAALIAGVGAALLPLAGVATALVVAGIGGSLADSLLGATLQSKRWCEHCRTWTERRVHTCQHGTRHARGVRWMTNDAVNFLATVAGAGLALAAASP